MTLKWEHIDWERRELKKIQIKTARAKLPRHIVPLSDAALAILEKWRRELPDSRFVFGLVGNDFDVNDSGSIYRRRNAVDKSINQALKVVGEAIGLAFPFTFHTARHTFAVNALNDGMSLSVVSRLLGHASTTVTENTYAAYLPRTLAEEVRALGYNFIPKQL